MKNNNINTMKRGSRSVVSTTLATAYIEHSFSIHSAYIGSRWQAGGKLLRFAAMMCLLLTIGSGNVWGALSSPYTCTFTSGMSMSGSNCTTGDVTWTISTTTGKGSPSITFGNQNGQSCIQFGSGKKNYYSKMTLTTSAFSAYNVSSVVIYISSNNGGSKTVKVTQGSTTIGTGSQSFSSSTWVTNCTRNTNAGSGGDLTVEISSDATATFVHSIKVTYSAASCTTKPTVGSSLTSVSATVNSITATVPISAIGGCNITENGLVYSTSVATPTVGAANCTKVTTTACGASASNKTVTISDLTCNQSYYVRGYATNAAGTSYTNVTTQSTSACPLYTVTLMDDSDTRTQASYGASVTLPSRAGCSGYTFAGWTKTWVTAQTSWTATAPTIIPAGSYTPAGNENLYPVYTKTEAGSGFSSYTKVTSAPSDWSGKYLISDGTSTATGAQFSSTALAITTLTPGTTEYTAYEFTITKNGNNNNYFIISPDGTYYVGYDSSTNLKFSDNPNTNAYLWTCQTSDPMILNVATTTRYIGVGTESKTDVFKAYSTSGTNAKCYLYKRIEGGSTTYYISVPNCCTDPGLAYATGSVTKTFGNGTFKNTLTNSHSVSVTYESSNTDVATVASDGTVTIQGAGNATITARFAGNSTYCADEASYTLTVNKADISPTLSYDPAAVTVGSTLTSFTLSGNSGSGSVSYSSSNDAIATVNSSGVVTGVAPGTVTITATIAATTNYNGNTATSNTITVNAAACTGVNSLHTGNKDQGGWVTNQCFVDADWGAVDDAIYVGAFPLTNECYVGYAGAGSYYGTNWAVGGIKTYDIPEGRTLGWNSSNYYESYPGGALGTFHIYKNSTDENYYLRFKPSSYILRTGSDGTSWTSREMTVSATNSHYYETAELDLTSTLISEHAYVDLKTSGGDGHVWCNFSNDRTASGNVKVKSSVGDADGNFRGTNLQAGDAGTHGKFRIDITKDVDNWKLAFVPMYRITYAAGTGASGSMDPSSYAEISTTIAAAANGFTAPTGKQFNGWSDGVNSYAAGANVTMNSNVTLTAQWTDIDYTVTVSQSPDVSATTTGQTSSAHYNGTINLTTTVPSGYRFVNWTTSDGFSITNPTSATTASFTMPAKNVTVTANFQQTHKVDWYVGGSAPANKIGDDGQTTVVDHGGKIEDFPATTPDGSACDKEFVGWTNTTSYTHGTSPLFTTVEGSPTINANASFYAVFAEVNSVSASLTKMTADDDLEVGDKIVIIAQDTRYGMYQASASSYVSYWTTTDVDGEPSLSEIEADNKKYLDVAAGSASNTWKLGDATNGYLYNASSTNLEFSTTNSSDLTLITWTDDSFTFVAGQEVSCRTDITGANANKWRGAGASCDPETGDNCSGTPYYYLYKYVPSSTTATGHTIICASCSNEVTVSFSAPGSGNTMTVAKGVTSISSGDAVKTCSAVSLTVTLTPAPHYSVTDFAATGVTGVTTTNVGNVYTVNIPADKTGTLTLTPTFTAETPLTITLDTHSKGTFTPIGTIYSGDSFTFPTVTPADPECASFLGWIEGTTFDGDGETTDPSDVTSLPEYHAASTSSGALTTNKTYTAVFGEKDTRDAPAYEKVTAAPTPPATWDGDHYLIVYEGDLTHDAVAFDGKRDNDENGNIDATNNGVAVTISDSKIAKTDRLAAAEWKIASITGGYSIQSASGFYIGRAANSNGLDTDGSTAKVNTLAYSSGFQATSAGSRVLTYNYAADQLRFRYMSSGQTIQLYKLNASAQIVVYTYTTNPACTPRYRVTVNEATGGTPAADKTYEHAGETITLTAHPATGYSFTSWAMENSSTHADATSLLSSSTATTATFSMPAYDVTVTASYAKKMVTELKVMDDETVVANTTGPVSGTLNVSTGANKTLDVVITPSDAFDHSWTATVSAGSTYASITNVTAEGFRVNGLAQGDATVTVTAPNDGSAKSVTLTVHVTDIMPEEIILKREGSDTPIETLVMYYDASESKGQYVKVNVGYSPSNPTNKAFTFSSALSGKVGSHSHAPASGYEVLVANGVTTDPVNCTFTSSADGSVTKVLAVTVLPILTDRFVDYVHGNATQTVSARLSADRYSIVTDINTPSISDASDADPTSPDCETAHYHLIGWLPQATAEALMAAGTPITEATEGLVRAGVQVEATGQTWCAIWAEEAE